MLGLYPVLAGLAMIREMKTLALMSGVANVFMAVGLVIIYYYLIDHEVDEKTIVSILTSAFFIYFLGGASQQHEVD